VFSSQVFHILVSFCPFLHLFIFSLPFVCRLSYFLFCLPSGLWPVVPPFGLFSPDCPGSFIRQICTRFCHAPPVHACPLMYPPFFSGLRYAASVGLPRSVSNGVATIPQNYSSFPIDAEWSVPLSYFPPIFSLLPPYRCLSPLFSPNSTSVVFSFLRLCSKSLYPFL